MLEIIEEIIVVPEITLVSSNAETVEAVAEPSSISSSSCTAIVYLVNFTLNNRCTVNSRVRTNTKDETPVDD